MFLNSSCKNWLPSLITTFLLVILVLLSTDANARRGKDKTRATGAIDAKTFEILTAAQALTENDQYDEALQTLDTIKNSDKLNSYAKSQMWNFYAFIYASQDEFKSAFMPIKR